MTIPVSLTDLPATYNEWRELKLLSNTVQRQHTMMYVCVHRSSEPCCGVICGLLCLCFCAVDSAITKTLSAWPVITRSACGEVVASERPAHFNNCYYYPESTTEWERDEEGEMERAIVHLKWRGAFGKWRDESRCVIDKIIAAQITVGMVEVKPRLVHQAVRDWLVG